MPQTEDSNLLKTPSLSKKTSAMVTVKPSEVVSKTRAKALTLLRNTEPIKNHMRKRLKRKELQGEVKMMWYQSNEKHATLLVSGYGCAGLWADEDARRGLASLFNMATAGNTHSALQAAALTVCRGAEQIVLGMLQHLEEEGVLATQQGQAEQGASHSGIQPAHTADTADTQWHTQRHTDVHSGMQATCLRLAARYGLCTQVRLGTMRLESMWGQMTTRMRVRMTV